MFNPKCKSGKKTKAARRAAAMLMTGALGASLAVTGINPGIVNVSAASWQENAEYIFEYLTQRLNYSEAAACGIMANIRCESTFNPHAWNAGGGSYGLCQWTGGRYSRLRNWCGSNGYDYTTIDGQLAYLQFELLNHYTGVENYIRSVENTSEGAYLAGQYYCYHFEAPASRGSVSVYRGNLASGVFWDSYRPAEWYQTDGVWHYILRDGSYKTGWLEIEGDTFYLDEDGNRISGWKNIKGNRYFFDDDGLMVSGWKKIDGRSYYFDESGELITGLIQGNDDLYLVNKNGDLKYSAAVEDYAVAWAEEAARRQTELAAAGTTQSNQSSPAGSGSKAASGLNKEAAADDGTEQSDNSENTFEIGTALADAQTEAVPGTDSAQETETVTALADAQTEIGTGTGSTQGTEPVTALADAQTEAVSGSGSTQETETVTALADAQTEAVPGTGSTRETETVTALADAQTEAVPGTGSTRETETVTALADAGFDSADQIQNITSSVDLLKKKEDTGDLPTLKEDTGNNEMQDAEAEPEASSPGEVIREDTAVADATKLEKTEGLVDLLPAELLRQAAEYIQKASNTQQGKDVDYTQQSEDPDTFPDQYAAAAQASLSAAVALNLEQEEEERLPDPSIGLAYAFYHDQPEASDRILNQFKSEGSSTESQKTGNEDQHVQDSTSKGTETQLPDHDQTAGEETGNGIDLQIPALALADKHRDQQEESSGKEKEAVSDTDQETSDESDDRESSDTSGTSEKAAASEESEEDKGTGSTAEESEEDKDTGTTAEESEEDKDAGSTAEESEEDKDTGSTAEESEEDKDTGSTSEESEEDKESGSDTVESEGDKDTGSTSEESEEDKESGSDTEESEEGKTDEQREQDEDDTSSSHSDKDSSDKDASEEADDASSGHSSENVSDKNADNDSADSADNRDEAKEKDSRKNTERGEDKADGSVKNSELEDNTEEDSQIHIRLTEKKFYDISEEELEDLADILRERKVLQVVDGKDKDITSKTYMDVEKINKRDYGFSVIIRAEYGDSSDEEKVRIYLTR